MRIAVEGRRIANATLDAAHIGASEASRIGERFLRMAMLLTDLADTRAEFLEGGMLRRIAGLARHAADSRRSVSDQATPDRTLRQCSIPPRHRVLTPDAVNKRLARFVGHQIVDAKAASPVRCKLVRLPASVANVSGPSKTD